MSGFTTHGRAGPRVLAPGLLFTTAPPCGPIQSTMSDAHHCPLCRSVHDRAGRGTHEMTPNGSSSRARYLSARIMTGAVGRRWSRRLRHVWLAPVLMGLFASVGDAQTPAPEDGRQTPDFTMQVWGQVVTDFNARISSYVELRSRLESGLPAPAVTNDPAEIRGAERALARKIRAARNGAKQGEIFTPTISVEFKKALLLELTSNTRETVMDDNPGGFSHAINGTYPKERPLSTVPINILVALPRLPDDVEYRFLGRHLILYDTRANVILDRIPCAIPRKNGRVGCGR